MPSTLTHNVRIFDGESVISSDGCILFENSSIKLVSVTTPSPLPTVDIVINGENHTVLPGLIDGHVHAHSGVPDVELAIKFGVTTVLDMMSAPEELVHLREATRGRTDVADFRSAGNAALVDGGWPAPIAIRHHPDKVAQMVLTWNSYLKMIQEKGLAIFGEPLPHPSPELNKALVEAAHVHGLIAVVHAFSQDDTMEVLEAGVDGLAHCFFDKAPVPAVLDAYKRNNSFCVPTLVVVTSLTGHEVDGAKEHVERDLAGKVMREELKMCYCQRLMMATEGCNVQFAYETVKMLKEAGIDIIAGTDSGPGVLGTAFGLALHQELSLYTTRCDFTGAEALRSATVNPARRFRLSDRGRLAPGMRADAVMVEGDPTVDIRCSLNIVSVWREGEALRS
ncbi:hypothetical protein AK830_g8891 [Neonectria ditissima]|uniref:Amidohydrolase-related domain-containing protein n=1 Tax=Neonectria ditissima TaxID=78410 RepID=A0A0P7ASX4_9HYPO|nr:hypothetical protein AK830_g8891 [Neonectria ditissima]